MQRAAILTFSFLVSLQAQADINSIVVARVQRLADQFKSAKSNYYSGKLTAETKSSAVREFSVGGFVGVPDEISYSPLSPTIAISLSDLGSDAAGANSYSMVWRRDVSKPGASFTIDGASQSTTLNAVFGDTAEITDASFSGSSGSIPGLPHQLSLSFRIIPSFVYKFDFFANGRLTIAQSPLNMDQLIDLLSTSKQPDIRNQVDLYKCSTGTIDRNSSTGHYHFHLEDLASAWGNDIGLPSYGHAYVIPFSADVEVDSQGSLVQISNVVSGTPYRHGGYPVECNGRKI